MMDAWDRTRTEHHTEESAEPLGESIAIMGRGFSLFGVVFGILILSSALGYGPSPEWIATAGFIGPILSVGLMALLSR